MVLFDVSRYEMPDQKDVSMDRTRHNMGVFLSAYLSARCRVGQPREPKVTASFSLTPPPTVDSGPEAEQIVIQQEEAKEEFDYLHKLFVRGYATIQHPFKPDITERRKKIFYDRYINGLAVYIVAEKNAISEELVIQESAKSIIQFSASLELLIFK